MSVERTETGVPIATSPDQPVGCCGGKFSLVKKILFGLLLLVAVFLAVVAIQPTEFTVERTTTISAPPSAVFQQVNDFHHWDAWSPWLDLDPQAKISFEGPSSGEGAIYRWSGNADVGEGSMTILESRPDELIRIKLEFIRPFAGANTVEFTFKPEGDQTSVAWSMFGNKNFVSKAICMFVSMDDMIGGKFDEGLARLKKVVEEGDK